MTKINLTLEKFKQKASKNLTNTNCSIVIPITNELISDLESPVMVYYKACKDEDYSFLLESADGGEIFGRYSILGANPLYIIKSEGNTINIYDLITGQVKNAGNDPFKVLNEFISKYEFTESDLPYFCGGAIGYISYDAVRHIEPVINDIFSKIEPCESFPEVFFMVSDTLIVFDHFKNKIYVINNVIIDKNSNLDELYNNAIEKIDITTSKLLAPFAAPLLELNEIDKNIKTISNFTDNQWDNAVCKAIEYINSGEIFQVVLSQRFCIDKPSIDNFMIYRTLRSMNPSPYMYYLQCKDFQIVGSSPEMLVKASPQGKVNTRPIAGTRKRGKNNNEDLKLIDELINDPKERAEHIMLVDLGRNDLGKVCNFGTVKISNLMDVERYSHVMHIVSDVTGQLKKEFNIIDLLKACFPAGTLSGAPKVRAMEIIYELENCARGPYGGCVGYIGFNKELNTAITIRTMLIKDNTLFIQAGAGIVADSIAKNERMECYNKAMALLLSINLLTP